MAVLVKTYQKQKKKTLAKGADANTVDMLQITCVGTDEDRAAVTPERRRRQCSHRTVWKHPVRSANGRIDIVRLLLEDGANGNAAGASYCSALRTADTKGHTDVVRILLENGAQW
jgi:hypothetical protein